MKIPKLSENGELPFGEHQATLEEVEEIFGRSTEQRRRLATGLRKAAISLAAAGVKRIWVDGSFVTSKEEPNDIDGCWEYSAHVDLKKVDPVFLMRSRTPMKEKYGVEFFPSSLKEGASGLPFPNFFQLNRDDEPKGILVVSLEGNL